MGSAYGKPPPPKQTNKQTYERVLLLKFFIYKFIVTIMFSPCVILFAFSIVMVTEKYKHMYF